MERVKPASAGDHVRDRLEAREQRDLGRVLGAEPAAAFDAYRAAERATLRTIRLALTSARLAGDLWRDVEGLVWVGPNQAGLVVADARGFHDRAREAVREDGARVFRADPRWLLRLFKHGAEWSLRERDVRDWGIQLYRRGRGRRVEGEVVVDVDRVALEAGPLAHVRDVLRPDADPIEAWASLAARFRREE